MIHLCELTAISPVDGRYFGKTQSLSLYFSEHALFYYRVRVEVEYFIALCEWPIPPLADFSKSHYDDLRKLYTEYTTGDTERIKEIEKTTNHDVKAVEYFIKERFDQWGLDRYKEYIHFGLTSQDINNTAIPLSIREANENLMYPALQNLMNKIRVLAEEWKHVPMLARTHGQPASPTRLGKEFYVFFERLLNQFDLLIEVPYSAKFGGATGNFNAHHVAFPDIDWIQFSDRFVQNALGLQRS
ncbi:MAG: adenylosuccinate lyase, partial [Flavobacteriales bacterium]|nr:adenylosuccinate lyase [Flavobacteriales bacterium]